MTGQDSVEALLTELHRDEYRDVVKYVVCYPMANGKLGVKAENPGHDGLVGRGDTWTEAARDLLDQVQRLVRAGDHAAERTPAPAQGASAGSDEWFRGLVRVGDDLRELVRDWPSGEKIQRFDLRRREAPLLLELVETRLRIGPTIAGAGPSLSALRQVLAAARRGQQVAFAAAERPPSVLILDCADYAHAKAIVEYVQAFDPTTVERLLDEVEMSRGDA